MMPAARAPWSSMETAMPPAALPPRRVRSASRAPMRSSIPLLRLRDQAELLDAGAIHDVEHCNNASVWHRFVGFEQRALHTARAQHRPEALIEIDRSRGDAVEIDRSRCHHLNPGRIVGRQLEALSLGGRK